MQLKKSKNINRKMANFSIFQQNNFTNYQKQPQNCSILGSLTQID